MITGNYYSIWASFEHGHTKAGGCITETVHLRVSDPDSVKFIRRILLKGGCKKVEVNYIEESSSKKTLNLKASQLGWLYGHKDVYLKRKHPVSPGVDADGFVPKKRGEKK